MQTVDLINGNAQEIPLADESVHCIVTSIPYWGLRQYAGGFATVWGGDPDCSHQWDQVKIKDEGYKGRTRWQHGALRTDYSEEWKTTNDRHGEYCSLCGAWFGELGLEPTVDQFLSNMVQVFREIRRVLRPDGTLWLNVGDLYASSVNGTPASEIKNDDRTFRDKPFNTAVGGLKPKDMVGLPWMLALALRADGWWLRSDVIWRKTNPMPESIEDRPTKAHEYMFLLAKSERYYFDPVAIGEPLKESSKKRLSQPSFFTQQGGDKDSRSGHRSSRNALEGLKKKYDEQGDQALKNKRTVWEGDDALWEFLNYANAQGVDIISLVEGFFSGDHSPDVWEISTAPYKGAHFATYPPALVEPCILAGTSEKGVCPECGDPWKRITEIEFVPQPDVTAVKGVKGAQGQKPMDNSNHWDGTPRGSKITKTLGWKPTCDHDTEPIPATVFDPFVGSGTTLLVARKLGRSGIGADLSFDYLVNQARKRLSLEQLEKWILGTPKSGNGSKPIHKNKKIDRPDNHTQTIHVKRDEVKKGALPMFEDVK